MRRLNMSMPITYDKFFRITKCDVIIFFEDDFKFENSKKSIFYGLARLNLASRARLFNELNSVGANFVDEFQEYCNILDVFASAIDWENEIPKNDADVLFTLLENMSAESERKASRIKEIYNKVEEKDLIQFKDTLNQYGLGVIIPKCFEQIFDDYINADTKWKSFKIYTNFISKDKNAFKNDLKAYGEAEKMVICIVDNQLEEEPRAGEILSEIEEFNKKERRNIITAILSSKEKEEKISSNVFAEFVTKENPDDLLVALAKSAYSLLLTKLKNVYKKILEESFDEAVISKDIAYYFAKMASYEGVTNYKVVTDWINLFFRYKLNLNEEIFDIIKLTQLMNILNEEETQYSSERQKLNTFEAFDLNINKYYQPPAAGDIFKDNKGNYFVLVGQDCDLMIRQSGSSNNAVSELVKASVVEQKDTEKYVKNLEYMYVNNFRENDADQPKGLEIKYSSRVFLDNTILRLCCFNNEGSCKIHLEDMLETEIQDIMAPYLHDTYKKLQQYFCSINEIKDKLGDEMKIILESEFSPRQTYILQYEKTPDNFIIFPYRRVARLNRNYVLYLYKLFLEYRGRHPFDCINLTRHVSLTIPVVNSNVKISVEVILSSNRDDNRKHCYKKLVWYVNSDELERAVNETLNENIIIKESRMVMLDNSENVIECNNNRNLVVTKTKNGAQFKMT